MSTSTRHASTWTNSDGLVVGFGTRKPVVEGSVAKNLAGAGGVKSAQVVFSYTDTSVNVPVPKNAKVIEVKLVVETAFAGGTAVLVGDGSDADGYITATAGALANLTAGALIQSDGLYAYGATDTGAAELKLYTAADTIDLSYSGTFTAGKAVLVVNYV